MNDVWPYAGLANTVADYYALAMFSLTIAIVLSVLWWTGEA